MINESDLRAIILFDWIDLKYEGNASTTITINTPVKASLNQGKAAKETSLNPNIWVWLIEGKAPFFKYQKI